MVLAVLHAGVIQRVLEKQLYDVQADDLPADRKAQFSWVVRVVREGSLKLIFDTR